MLNAFLFIAIALVYAIAKVYLEKRLAPLDAQGDQRQLDELAFAKGCSVYELFRSAGSIWNFSDGKIESDFRRYLRHGNIPTYVHDYLCRHRQGSEQTYHRLIFSGGRPPYL